MSEKKVRSRPTPINFDVSYVLDDWRRKKSDGTWVNVNHESSPGSPTQLRGFDYVESESHLWPPEKGGPGDVGGPFLSRKHIGTISSVKCGVANYERDVNTSLYNRARFSVSGHVACPVEMQGVQPKWPELPTSTDVELSAAGATAVSRCKPTSSAAELGVALGEIRRDGIPSVPGVRTWREKTRRARNAGDEYLNVVFGWRPLENDVLQFGGAVLKSGDILSQYAHDRGKSIRRQYRYPVVEESQTQLLGSSVSPWGAPSTTSGMPSSLRGSWSKKTTTTTSRWFKGAFVYGIPTSLYDGGSVAEFGAKADRLFGLSLTPDVLWALTPWSWAIDWFTNTGDVLANISDMVSQGLVMEYGYLMETKAISVDYTLEGCTYNGAAIPTLYSNLTVVSKRRIRANPFGFGITWDGLSAAQIAIAAALGISRS